MQPGKYEGKAACQPQVVQAACARFDQGVLFSFMIASLHIGLRAHLSIFRFLARAFLACGNFGLP